MSSAIARLRMRCPRELISTQTASHTATPTPGVPTISGSPGAAQCGGLVTINGSNFGTPPASAGTQVNLIGPGTEGTHALTIVAGSNTSLLVQLPSTGLHTNGYSLVRHIAAEHELGWHDTLPGTDAPLADLLLAPHRSYLDAVRELRRHVDVRALAHITGGGIIDNVPRVLPAGLGVELDRSAWTVPPIFSALQSAGGINAEEMWRTFNMGLGMVVVVSAAEASAVREAGGMRVADVGRVIQQDDGPRVILR